MDLTRLQQDSPQIGDALLREQHLVVGLNQGRSSSTLPRLRKLLEVPIGVQPKIEQFGPMEDRAQKTSD